MLLSQIFYVNFFLVDFIGKVYGISRELWYRYVNIEGFVIFCENLIFEQLLDGYIMIFNMFVVFEVSDNYGE